MGYKLNDNIVYGNNSLGSKEMFKQRTKYQELYPSGSGFPGSFSFWEGNNLYYGRVDQQKRVIFPNETYLKQIKGIQKTVFVLNFVADAYRDFQEYMKIKIGRKFVEDNAITKPWHAVKGWENVHEAHHSAMTSAYTNFAGFYLNSTGKDKKIKDYDGFLKTFLNDYISDLISGIPFTKTGFIRSKYFTPMMSGLCIETATFDHGDDYEKYDKFVNNINFKTYLLAASKFGFMIDQNAPWRLIANLESDNMRSYISKYMLQYSKQGSTTVNQTNLETKHNHSYELDELGNGFTSYVDDPQDPGILHRHKVENFRVVKEESVTYNKLNNVGIGPHAHFLSTEPVGSFNTDDIYNTFYIKADEYDIDAINVYLRQFYNTYVAAFPSVSVPKLVSCSSASPFSDYGTTQKTKIAKVFRNPIGDKQHEEQYSELFWTKIYFIVRLRELNASVSPAKLKKNLQKMSKIYNFVDKGAALGYINQYLKQFY